MADRTETLLFLVDVQVRNANALRALDAEMDAALAAQDRRLLALGDAAATAGDRHAGLAAAMDAVAARGGASGPAAVPIPGGGRGPVVVQRQQSSSETQIWGARGAKNPGSRTNPIAFAAESAAASGLGGLAAKPDNGGAAAAAAQAAARAATPQPAAAPDRQFLMDAVREVESKVIAPENQRTLAAIAAASQIHSGTRESPMLAAARAVQSANNEPGLAAAVASVHAARARSGGMGAIDTLAAANAVHGVSAGRYGTLAAALAAARPPQPAAPMLLNAYQAAARMGVPRSSIYQMAATGALAGAHKQGGAWQIPEQAVIDAMAGGGGGGGVPPIIPVGRGGGGGNNNFLRRALWGTGMFGLAGFGTLGSFAGLGPEHLLMTGAGLLGSAGAAVGGAGMLGLGAAGTLAVGAGSDLGVASSTSADVQLLYKDYTALGTAVAEYGKKSKQAAQAQKQLNTDITYTLGNTPGVQAELQLAKRIDTLNTKWDQTTSHARQLVVQIADQGLTLANEFMPHVVAAAQRNLAIIDNDLKPLTSWLAGPEGIQIFQDLENQFATNLPSSIHAFDQGLELLLRVVDIASQYTGGFTQHLDALFTRLNSYSNVQLGAEVSKLVDDFRLWDRFVTLLIGDIHRLFSNDVGTGNSIIAELTGMLQKLKQWEDSVQGRQDLMTIFTVHKAEIDQLLQLIPTLIKAFEPIYMAVAPALTSAFTAVAGAINDVVRAIEKIPGGAMLLGLGLVGAKTGLLGTLFRGAGTALGAGPAAAGGSAAATVAGGAAAGTSMGVGARLLGLIGKSPVGAGISDLVEGGATGIGSILGGGALGEGLAGLGAAAAPAAGVLLPLLAAGGLGYGAYKLLTGPLSGLFGGGSHPPPSRYPHASPQQILSILGRQGEGALHGTPQRYAAYQIAGAPIYRTRPGESTLPSNLASTKAGQKALQDWVKTASSAADVAKMNVTQLNDMARAGDTLAKNFSKYGQAIERLNEPIKKSAAENEQVFATMTARWKVTLTGGLKQILDITDTNTRLIAHVLGLNSDQGRQAFATNISRMVAATTQGMLMLQVPVKQGLKSIDEQLTAGVKDGAVSWQTQWQRMFATLKDLYANHLIDTKTYTAQLKDVQDTAVKHLTSSTEANYKSMISYLKGQLQDGNLTQQAYNKKAADLRSQDAANMTTYAGNLVASMQSAGKGAVQGTDVVLSALNQALKALGAKPVSLVELTVSAAAASIANAAGSIAAGATGGAAHHATGGKVTRPMYMVGEEAPSHPEWVIATNPAYRPRNVKLWAQAGRALGIPGFAQGGVYSYGQLEGLWDRAGGPRSLAGLAAAIAEAESGGNANAYNSSGASGLWQILGVPFPGNPFDPMTNARMAVSKYESAHGFSPWVTYTSGAYRAFMHGNVPPSMAGAGAVWKNIVAPRVAGGGALGSIVQHAMNRLASAANRYGRRHMPAGGAGGSGSGGAFPGTGHAYGLYNPKDLGTFDGLPVADWIIPELAWARAHGWSGHVTSGWRSPTQVVHGVFATAPQGQSEHQYDIYPGGAVDVSDYQQFAQIIRGYGGKDKLIQLGIDPLHFSGTGHRTGGRVGYAGAFAGGGAVTAHGPTLALFGEHGDETALFVPHTDLARIASAGTAATTSHASSMSAAEKARKHREALAAAHRRHEHHRLTDVLGLDGGHVGSVYQRRGLLHHEKLPEGALIDLLGPIVDKATKRGLNAVLAGFGRFLAHVGPGTSLHAAGQLLAGLPDQRKLDKLNDQLHKLNNAARRREKQADGLEKLADRSRGKVHHELVKAAEHARHQARQDRHQAAHVQSKIVDIGHQVASSRQAQLVNTAVGAALSKLTNQFQTLQTTSQNQSSIASMLQALPAGTSLASLGLHGAALAATGLHAGAARSLLGGGPAGFGVIAAMDKAQAHAYKGEQAKLEAAYKDAVKTHNKRLETAITQQLSAVDDAMLQAIAGSQAAIVQKVQARAGQFADKASRAAGNLGVLQGLQGVNAGTSLSSLGLSPSILKVLGINPGTARGMIGNTGASGIAAGIPLLQVQQQAIEQELDYYKSALHSLKGDARTQAISAMQGLAQQLIDVDVSIQQAVVQEVQATAQTFQDKATSIAGSLSVLQGIEGLAPGTSLASLGLSPAILQTLGISPGSAGSLVGTSLSYYQGLASSQGGVLTSQQLAGATAGIGGQDQLLLGEEAPIEQELAYYQSQLPSLSGDARTQAISAMQGLAGQLLNLQSTIDANTQGLQQLTQATSQNTSATTSNTGAMTGTVTYSFQGQNYLASDNFLNVGVGS